jgi:hypothetical protein
MRRAVFFLPVAGLIAFVGYLGFQRGQVPSETEIINRFAAIYLQTAPNGAALTDCAASPHPDPAVRMVINCAHPFGVTTTFYVGPRGATVPQPQGPST